MSKVTNGVAAPQLQGMDLLTAAIAKAKAGVGGEFFDITECEIQVSEKTGNTGFRVTCESGKVITFWETYEKSGHTMFDCVEHVEGNKFRVVVGAKITTEGNIIPKGVEGGGFWK
jgi:hypothetical protein